MPLVVLTGPKHSGKTSAGRALGEITGGKFVDIDELIEEREGFTARVLYRRGRDVFQKAEAEALASVLAAADGGKTVVAAAGGGLIDNEAAVRSLAGNPLAVIFYIEVSAGTAWSRIEAAARNGEGMPAFLDGENPGAAHAALHERRAAAYKKLACFTVNAEGKTPRQTAALCAARLLSETPA
jgi:shikimate kinase